MLISLSPSAGAVEVPLAVCLRFVALNVTLPAQILRKLQAARPHVACKCAPAALPMFLIDHKNGKNLCHDQRSLERTPHSGDRENLPQGVPLQIYYSNRLTASLRIEPPTSRQSLLCGNERVRRPFLNSLPLH